jgi:hypothetical protein
MARSQLRNRNSSPVGLAIIEAGRKRGRLAVREGNLAELKAKELQRKIVEAREVAAKGVALLPTMRAGGRAVPRPFAARLPHLSKHDVAEIEAEIRTILIRIGSSGHGVISDWLRRSAKFILRHGVGKVIVAQLCSRWLHCNAEPRKGLGQCDCDRNGGQFGIRLSTAATSLCG